jgi:hypothetical protein
MFKDEQKKNGGLYYNTLSEAESNNYLHKNTIQWMKEMHKHLNSLYELYNENGISFSNCVDRQYRKIADKYDANFEVIRCTGNYQNQHNVPKFVFENMKRGFEDYDGEKIV